MFFIVQEEWGYLVYKRGFTLQAVFKTETEAKHYIASQKAKEEMP